MVKFKDPFEMAFEEQDETPPESPVDIEKNDKETSVGPSMGVASQLSETKEDEEEEEEEEEDNMALEIGKLSSTADPAKSAKWQNVFNQFTEEQLNRYESFRRSTFKKASVKRLLTNITGITKVSEPMTIVVSGVAKIFVGELIEAAKMIMAERKESGTIRPCHIREAYRRLKLEGKIPRGSVPRLFH